MPDKKKIYKLPTYLGPREKNNKHKYKYIPKKIFQTGESCEVTKGMYNAVHTWIDKNPDWEYHFFDNKACRGFIKKNFPKKVLDAYDNLVPGAYKADLWRYCVLYIHGGVYVDNKCELLANSLNDVIPKDVEFLSLQEMDALDHSLWGVSDLRLSQGFIVTKPKHAFIKKVIDLVLENVRTGYYGYTPVCPTGPRAIGKAIQLVLQKKEVNPNWIGSNNISGFKFVLWPDQLSQYKWSRLSRGLIQIDKNADPIPLLTYSYKNYKVEQLNLNVQEDIGNFYRYAWHMDKIYLHGKVLRPKYNSFYKKVIKFDLYQTCLKRLLISRRYEDLINVSLYAIKKNRFPYFKFIKGYLSRVIKNIFS